MDAIPNATLDRMPTEGLAYSCVRVMQSGDVIRHRRSRCVIRQRNGFERRTNAVSELRPCLDLVWRKNLNTMASLADGILQRLPCVVLAIRVSSSPFLRSHQRSRPRSLCLTRCRDVKPSIRTRTPNLARWGRLYSDCDACTIFASVGDPNRARTNRLPSDYEVVILQVGNAADAFRVVQNLEGAAIVSGILHDADSLGV